MATKLRFSSIADMLEKHAQNHSDQVCLYYPDQMESDTYAALTFNQLNNVTNYLAKKFSAVFSQNQSNESPIVCLLGYSNANYLLTIYALFKLDVIIFPLSIRNSAAAIKHLLETSNASYLFYSDEFSSKINSFDSSISLHRMEEMNIAQLISHTKSSFELKSDPNELDRIRIIFHR
jgi:acyl-CoA synthetase (AMP-forming)/AMP-acid ligase II